MTIETDPHLIRRLRSAYGRSTELWSAEVDRQITDGSWTTLTGRPSADYNIALCHADDGDGIAAVEAKVKAKGAPAVIMLAGPALGHAQILGDTGWVCVGQNAFMRASVPRQHEGPKLPAAASERRVDGFERIATARDLEVCRALAADAFSTSLEDAEIILPERLIRPDSNQRLWAWRVASGRLVACVCTVDIDDVSVIWSMATNPKYARQGHGKALLHAVHSALAQADTTRHVILSSTNAGYRLYLTRYEILERWQLWSRPRWVIGTG